MLNTNREALAGKKAVKHGVSVLYSIFRILLLICIGYLILYPLIYMISSSLKPESAYFDKSIIYIPKTFTFEYYKVANKTLSYADSLKSTVLYELVSAGIEIMICSFIAYGMARFDFKIKPILNFFLILIILVPVQMLTIPLMMNYSQLDFLGILGLFNKLTGIDLRPNILNTPLTFYLPSLFGVGLRAGIIIYIYIQFFKGLPKELEEAAWIDGAGLFRTFFSLAIPSSGVVFTTVTLFSLVWHWNDYYLAIMYLSNNFPLAVKIYDLQSLLETQGIYGGGESISAKSAACFIFVVPLLVVYIFLQRKFVQSIDRVGITG